MPIATRTFRVFVSSTFDDLKEERNALQRQAWPKLRSLCEHYGARFQAIDLRWGVRDEAALDQKTMEICQRELERCQKTGIKPNFMVLVGARYGWRPLPSRIRAEEFETVRKIIGNAEERALVNRWYRRDDNAVPPEYVLLPRTGAWVKPELWQTLEHHLHQILLDAARAAGFSEVALVKYWASATHQEILKGLGENPEDRCDVFAFCRNVNDEDCDPDLVGLKHLLRTRLPAQNVLTYETADLEGLCQNVERVLGAVIKTEAAAFQSCPALQLEIEANNDFANDRAQNFHGRKEILDAIADYVRGEEPYPVVLHGASGSGKSAIMAKASAQATATFSDAVVVRRFIGVSPESSSGIALLRGMCEEIAQGYGGLPNAPTEFDSAAKTFCERLAFAIPKQPLILFIDALDQIDEDDRAHSLAWLPVALPPHCRIVVSTVEVPRVLQGARLIEVGPLPMQDADETLKAWLADGDCCRTLQPGQRIKVLDGFMRCGLPLYLRLAFEEAGQWKSFNKPSECTLGEGLAGIIDALFQRLSARANHGGVLVSRSLAYLTAARYGLTEDEILDVLTDDPEVWGDFEDRKHHDPPERRLPAIVWSRFYFDLEPYLTEHTAPGGTVVTFYHRQLSERASARFLAGDEGRFRHAALARYFDSQSDWLGEGAEMANARKLSELVRQQRWAGLLSDANATLRNLEFLTAKCHACLALDLQEDYEEIVAAESKATEKLSRNQQADAARRTSELAQYRQFFAKHLHAIRVYPDCFFSLIWHEGFDSARAQVEELVKNRRWPIAWLQTTPVPLPDRGAGPEVAMRAELVSRFTFGFTGVADIAAAQPILFYLRSLGEIRTIDSDASEKLPRCIAIRRVRPVSICCSPDAGHLAIAYENGEADVIRLDWSPDRALLSQEVVATFRYLLPEYNDPVMVWRNSALWYQYETGLIVCLDCSERAVRRLDFPLATDAVGDLRAVVFGEDRAYVAIQKKNTTTLLASVLDNRIRVIWEERAIVHCACPCSEISIAMAFGDRRVLVLQHDPETVHIQNSIIVGNVPLCMVSDLDRLVWVDNRGIQSWMWKESAHADPWNVEQVFAPGRAIHPKRLLAGPDGACILLTDSEVIRFNSQQSSCARKATLKYIFVDKEACGAVEERNGEHWLVWDSGAREVRILAITRSELLYGFNPRSRTLLALQISGPGVLVDLASAKVQPIDCSNWSVNNSCAADDGGFWLTDRVGNIIHIGTDGRCRCVANVGLKGPGPGCLESGDGALLWYGYCDEFNRFGEDSVIWLVQFAVDERRSGVAVRQAARGFAKDHGKICATLFDAKRSRFGMVWGGHHQFGNCLSFGSADDFINGHEQDCEISGICSSVVQIVSLPDSSIYALLCTNGEVVVIGPDGCSAKVVLQPTVPFTRLATGHTDNAPFLVAEGTRRLYSCTLLERSRQR